MTFGLIIPGQAIRTDLSQTSVTSFSASVPVGGNHLVVFLTSPLNLPSPDLVAGIYLFASEAEGWRYLGWISDSKPSAVFKTSLSGTPFQLGISIETLKESSSLVVASKSTAANVALLVVKNLYNYISSFLAGGSVDQQVAIPLRVFNEWYQGLSRKLSLDPQYLEKTSD